MTIHKVLIPLDGSEWSRQVVPHVCRVLSPTDYDVILFRAADKPADVLAASPLELVFGSMLQSNFGTVPDTERAQHPMYTSQAWERTEAALKDELRAAARVLQDAGYKVSIEVRFGDPAEEIVACVQGQDIDLVVMATHGRTGLKRFVLGSVAEQVLRSLDVPVILVRPV